MLNIAYMLSSWNQQINSWANYKKGRCFSCYINVKENDKKMYRINCEYHKNKQAIYVYPIYVYPIHRMSLYAFFIEPSTSFSNSVHWAFGNHICNVRYSSYNIERNTRENIFTIYNRFKSALKGRHPNSTGIAIDKARTNE